MPTLQQGRPPSGKHRPFSRKQTPQGIVNASLKARKTLKDDKATLNAKAAINAQAASKAEKAAINANIQKEHAASRAAKANINRKAAINAAIEKEKAASNSKTGGNKTRRARKSRNL